MPQHAKVKKFAGMLSLRRMHSKGLKQAAKDGGSTDPESALRGAEQDGGGGVDPV